MRGGYLFVHLCAFTMYKHLFILAPIRGLEWSKKQYNFGAAWDLLQRFGQLPCPQFP